MTVATTDPVEAPTLARMHVYLAATGRSGSTLVANWLTLPPDQVVLLEPELLAGLRHRSLIKQLEALDRPVSEAEWDVPDSSITERAQRILGPRLTGEWGVKEVKPRSHLPTIAAWNPMKIIVNVRDMRSVVLSFLEKHRLQGNHATYDDDWVRRHCAEAAQALVDLVAQLDGQTRDYAIVRYEDFVSSADRREGVAAFLGWRGGGELDRGMDVFNRRFERERHRGRLTALERSGGARGLEAASISLAGEVADRCWQYQRAFGYG